MTREVSFVVHRRATRTSPQRHQDCRDNPGAAKLRISDCGLRIVGRVPAGPPGLRPGDGGAPLIPPASSLSGDPLCETKPIWGRSLKLEVSSAKQEKPGGPGRFYKQSQFRAARPASGVHCAKQTQFRKVRPAGEIPIIPSFHYSIVPAFQSDACHAKQSQWHRSELRWWVSWRLVARRGGNYNGRRTGCAGHILRALSH